MKDEILAHLNDPGQLEKLYRANKMPFKREFGELYPEIKDNTLATFWNERLRQESDDINFGTRSEISGVIIASILAGIIAKIPAILNIDEQTFYMRNVCFIIFPILSFYFAWKNKMSIGKIGFITAATFVGLIFINVLPNAPKSDTLVLSCIHLGLVLWAILGFAFVGYANNQQEKRLLYLKYNGDLLVMTALILIAGAIMTGVTLGLFGLIGFKIEKYYFNYVGIFGLAAAPIVGTYLTQSNPQLVGKVSPVIAKIFSPLVLVMLVVYLGAVIYSGKNPYNDREFLLIFNALLLGVMAIIFFAVSDSNNTNKSRIETWILFLLSSVTIIVNAVALSAIFLRIAQAGVTPNRLAVLGSNVLILINLLLIVAKIYKILSKKDEVAGVGKVIAGYLPFYVAWAVIVTFLFPLIFGFR